MPEPSSSSSGQEEQKQRERRARLREAAMAAERHTGTRERTDEQAQRSLLVRIGIIALGSLVTLAGVGMLVLPGPGIVVVIAGLGILATEVSWAERLLAYAKRKARVDKVTAQAPWIKPVAAAVTVIAVVVSVVYTVRWR
ncbi:MAG: PGPGW domain-containing protein [Iamia sp.]